MVTFVTMADRTVSLQLGSPHREVSQVSMGSTMDILTKLESVIIETKGAGSKHALASVFVESWVRVSLHPEDSLKREVRRAKREERISENVLDHPGRCWTHEVSELGSADPVLDCADTRPPARARNVRVDKESIVKCVLSKRVGWDEKEKEV